MQSFLWLLAFTVTPAVISWSYRGHILTLKPLQTGLNLNVLMSCYGHISKQWALGSTHALSQVWKKTVDMQSFFHQLPFEDVWTLFESRRGKVPIMCRWRWWGRIGLCWKSCVKSGKVVPARKHSVAMNQPGFCNVMKSNAMNWQFNNVMNWQFGFCNVM